MTSHSLVPACQRSYPTHYQGLNGPPGQVNDDLTVGHGYLICSRLAYLPTCQAAPTFLVSFLSCGQERSSGKLCRRTSDRPATLSARHFEQVNLSSMQRDIDSPVCAGGAVRPHCLLGLASFAQGKFRKPCALIWWMNQRVPHNCSKLPEASNDEGRIGA